MLAEPTAVKSKRSNGWLVGVYFGLAIRPVTFLFSYLFSGPVAFALAMLATQLLAYPVFFRTGPRASWARNWGFWHFAVLALLASVIGYFFSRAFFPNP